MDNKDYLKRLEPKELEGESELMMELDDELAKASEPIGNPKNGLTQTDLRRAAQGLIKRGYKKSVNKIKAKRIKKSIKESRQLVIPI